MVDKVNDHDGSNFRVYWGYASADKALDSRKLNVYCPELFPSASGMLDNTTRQESVELMDIFQNPIQTRIQTTNSLEAEYFDMTSNRQYPPDVRKGEAIMIIQYSNDPKYYWYSSGRSDDLRTEERLRWSIAATKAVSKQLDDSNSYYIEFNSIEKTLHLHTSKANGELHTYDWLFDLKTGTVSFYDDIGNEIEMVSDDYRISMKNGKGAQLTVNGEDVLIMAPRDIIIKAGKQLVYQVPYITFNKSGSGKAVTEMNVSGLTINADNIISLNAPVVETSGNVKVKGVLTSGPHRAEGYSTGDVGGGNTSPSTDIAKRSANNPAASPDTGAGDGNNRHAVAHEQMDPIVELLVEAIKDLQGRVGGGVNVDPALTWSDQSIMLLNRGK